MPALTEREKRTVRLGVVAVVVYLACFYGLRGWRALEEYRTDYQTLVRQAGDLKIELQRHENKILLTEKLKKETGIDPEKLARATVVGQASAAIQQAAQRGGIKLGPIRESPGNRSGRELASMQLDATGPVAAITSLLHQLETTGFPLIVDSIQIDPDPRGPGMVKLTLRIVVLDHELWKQPEGRRNA
jgi:hypothetical protein